MVRELPIEGDLPLWEVPGWRERFGVTAGITGRGDGFDLGLGGSAPIGPVLDRWNALAGALPGCNSLVVSRQVHGTEVLAHRSSPGSGIYLSPDADGHMTDREGIVLAVTVADCVPIYLLAPQSQVVALLHAG